MPRNIEIKLRCDSLAETRVLAHDAGATYQGALFQTDTFFSVATGRLKLRETRGRPAELIAYAREDVASAKASEYVVTPVSGAATMLAALTHACGVAGVVRKRRDLLLWRNVRIHFDRVEGLGHFVELEAVVGEVNEVTSAQHVETLIDLLDLRVAEVVGVAYVDLLAPSPGTPGEGRGEGS